MRYKYPNNDMHYISSMFRKLIFLSTITLLATWLSSEAKPSVKKAPTPSWVVQHNTKSTQKVNKRDINNGYYLTFYDEQINIPLQSEYTHLIKHIQNESGVQNSSEISISFAGTYQTLTFHTVDIIRDGKRINKLNIPSIKVINAEPSLADYQLHEYYNAVLILDDVRKGDKIDIAYTIKGFNPIFNDKFDRFLALYTSTPILNYNLSIISASNKKLNYKCYNEIEEPEIKTKSGNTIYSWHVDELSPYESEGNPPAWYRGYKYIEISEYDSWAQVASWANKLFEGSVSNLPEPLKQQADKWYRETENDKEKYALKALRFVQNEIRYLGLEIGEYSHRPHLPSKTYRNRYGDCKDKTVLLVALLRYKDIDAHPLLISTYLGEKVIETLPAAGRFDHVIAEIKLGNRVIHVDPTMSHQRGDIFHTYIPDYGLGLKVSSDTKGLSDISFLNENKTIIDERLEVSYDAESKLDVKTVYIGADADKMRYRLSVSGMSEMESDYENFYTEKYGEAEVRDLLIIEDDTVKNEITIYEYYTLYNIWEESDGQQVLQPTSSIIADTRSYMDKTVLDRPVYLSHPENITHTVKMVMPDDWDEIPSDEIDIDRSHYRFTCDFYAEGDIITLRYNYESRAKYIPASDAEQYADDYDEMSEYLSFNLTRNKKVLDTVSAMEDKGGAASINWIAVFAALLIAGGTFYILLHANKQNVQAEIFTDAPISGWLIFFAFILCLKPLIYLYTLFSEDYFSTASWYIFSELGQTGLQLFLLLTIMCWALMIVFSIWVLIWFFQKRDIFPKMFITMALIEVGISLLVVLMAVLLKDSFERFYPEVVEESITDLVRSVIYAAIWISAVRNSHKVKRVFTKPYQYNSATYYEAHSPQEEEEQDKVEDHSTYMPPQTEEPGEEDKEV